MATQETAKTLFLTVGGIKFAYRLIGATKSPGHPPLLLLNHFRSNIDLWDPTLVNALASGGRQVITYDYAGLGHSGGEVELSIKGFASNLIAFLRALLPTLGDGDSHGAAPVAKFDVLGFSLGGFVAQQLVLDAPDLVNRLVLSGTGQSGSLGVGAEPPMAEVQSAIMADPPDGAAVADAFFPSFVAREAGQAWLGRIFAGRAGVAGKDGEPPAASFLMGPGLARLTEAYLKWLADPLPYALLHTIQKDVLVTAGDNDLIVPTANSFVLARQLPRANLVMYPGSGHGHLFQYAEFFARQVTEFLNGEWPAPPRSAGSIRPLADN